MPASAKLTQRITSAVCGGERKSRKQSTLGAGLDAVACAAGCLAACERGSGRKRDEQVDAGRTAGAEREDRGAVGDLAADRNRLGAAGEGHGQVGRVAGATAAATAAARGGRGRSHDNRGRDRQRGGVARGGAGVVRRRHPDAERMPGVVGGDRVAGRGCAADHAAVAQPLVAVARRAVVPAAGRSCRASGRRLRCR